MLVYYAGKSDWYTLDDFTLCKQSSPGYYFFLKSLNYDGVMWS